MNVTKYWSVRNIALAGILVLIKARAEVGKASYDCMKVDNGLWSSPREVASRDSLMPLLACPAGTDKDTMLQVDAVACNWFVARAAEKLFGATDFTPNENGHWLNANEIAQYVGSHGARWTKIGNADSQAALDAGAQAATDGQLVIAVKIGDPHGHVALLLPGKPKESGKWKSVVGAALRVPASAAFSLDHVESAYVGCRLSAAFSNPAIVELWKRTTVPPMPPTSVRVE